MSERTTSFDDDICSYFRSQGGQCVTSNRGQHLHWCPKCESMIVQTGHGLSCKNRCLYVHMDFGVRGEKASLENGFNPVITRLCTSCRGEGFLYTKEDATEWTAHECHSCNGTGWITEHQYVESSPSLVYVDSAGWARCPKCNFRFMPSDTNTMVGDRHKRCGQRIEIKQGNEDV